MQRGPRGRTAPAAALALALLALPRFLPAQTVSEPPATDAAPGAGDELVTDRPDVTESTSIVRRGWVQFETGGVLLREAESGTLLAGPGTLARIGLGPRVEARLGWLGVLHRDNDGGTPPPCPECADATGAGDGAASIKVLVFGRQGARPDLALLPAVTLPVGEEPFTTGRVDPGFKLLLGNDLTGSLEWAANLGAAWLTNETGRERPRRTTWSISLGLELGPAAGAFFEYFAEDPEDEPAAHAFDMGLTYLVSPNAQIDLSGGVGLAEEAPDWFMGAGLALRFGL